MPDETREPQDAPQEEPEYQAPKAEELPEADTMGAASGPVATGQDGQVSDRNLKTGFAEVDVDAVLAAVREHPVDVSRARR
jgi:hypothetical protein